MKVSEADINAAMGLIAAQYPDDRFDIWCKSSGEYTAYLHQNPQVEGDNDSIGWGKTALQAAENLILNTGERNLETLKAKRVAELRKELAALEQNTPLT